MYCWLSNICFVSISLEWISLNLLIDVWIEFSIYHSVRGPFVLYIFYVFSQFCFAVSSEIGFSGMKLVNFIQYQHTLLYNGNYCSSDNTTQSIALSELINVRVYLYYTHTGPNQTKQHWCMWTLKNFSQLIHYWCFNRAGH